MRALALLGLAGLAGCSYVSGMFSSGAKSSAGVDKGPAACPTAVALRPLANTAVFGSDGRRPMDVGFYGLISEVDVKCQPFGDTLRASLDIVIAAERGPTGRGDAVDFAYFVAVTGPDQAIISKQTLSVRVAFAGASRRAAVTDHIEQAIALGGRRPEELNIIVGFQQTPDVVEFYRSFRGR